MSASRLIRYPYTSLIEAKESGNLSFSGKECLVSILNCLASLVDAIEAAPLVEPYLCSWKSFSDQEKEREQACAQIVNRTNSLTDLFEISASSPKLGPFRTSPVYLGSASITLSECRSRINKQMRELQERYTNRHRSLASNSAVDWQTLTKRVDELVSEAEYELSLWLHQCWPEAFPLPGETDKPSSVGGERERSRKRRFLRGLRFW